MKAPEVIDGFSCLEFKARAQERLREATAGMTTEEELRYLNHMAETGPFAELWRSLPAPPPSRDESHGGATKRRT
jgi:hypothetical protein